MTIINSYTKLALVAILLMALVVPVLAGEHFTNVGEIPLGNMQNIIYDNVIYNQEGNYIRVYNITPGVNYSAMTANSYIASIRFPYIVKGFNVSGGYLYVVTSNTLSKMDISNKLSPTFVGNSSAGFTMAQSGHSVVVEGNYAYIGSVNGLVVYDISGTIPSYITKKTYYTTVYDDSPSAVIASDGNYLYTGYGDDNYCAPVMSVWDISNKTNPTRVKDFTFDSTGYGRWVRGISYKNNTIYLSAYYSNLWTVDVTNRTNPSVIDIKYNYDYSDRGTGFMFNTIVGDKLYTGVRYNGLRIFNISTNTPVYVGGQWDSTGYTQQVSANENLAIISTQTAGLVIYNTTTKSAPVIAGRIPTPAEVFVLDATTIGSIDVLAQGGRNVGNWYWNITNPYDWNTVGYSFLSSINPVPSSTSGARTYLVPFSGNYSYSTFGASGGGFFVINMTGIENKPLTPTYSTSDWGNHNCEGIWANNSFVFTHSYDDRLTVWNNTNKDKAPLTEISRTYGMANMPSGVGFYPYHTNYLLTLNSSKISIINITNVSHLTVEKEFYPGYHSWRINYDPVKEIVYTLWKDTSKNNWMISQVDVADINNIHNDVGTYDFGWGTWNAHDMARNGTDIFVAGSIGYNVRQISFDNPISPRFVDGGYTLEGTGDSITFYKGFVYVGGTQILTAFNNTPSGIIPPNPPIVQWTANKYSGVSPLVVQFVSTSVDYYNTAANQTLVNNNHLWNFDDGTTSNAKNPNHVFSTKGQYNVSLRILGAEGYNTSANQSIYVQDTGADFFANRTYNETPPLSVEFTSMETNGVTYAWDFEDDGIIDATTRNATHTYTESGKYRVNYTVVNGTETASKIRYPAAENKDYIVIGGGECAGSVAFSPSNVASSFSGYGDDTWATMHARTTDNIGNGDSSITAAIYATPTAEHYSEIDRGHITWNTSTLTGLTVTGGNISYEGYTERNGLGTVYGVFVNSSPANPSSIVSEDWDNTHYDPMTAFFPYSGGSRANLNSFGISKINTTGRTTAMFLTHLDANNTAPAWAPSGNSMIVLYSSLSTNLKLRVAYTGTCYPTNPVPVTDFISNTSWGYHPLAVQFYDASSNNPTTWNWSFGDGNYSSSQNPTHIYEGKQAYNVTLISTNSAGSNTTVKVVTSSPIIPVTDFSCTPLSGNYPLAVNCTDLSTNNPDLWNWTFNNEGSVQTQNSSWAFYSPGSKTVVLNASTIEGSQTKTKAGYITVTSSGIYADFTAEPTSGGIGAEVQFNDTSTGNPTHWNWSFGDGNYSSYHYPTHQYNSSGSFTVTLNASTDFEYDTETKAGYITVTSSGIYASFTSNTTFGASPLAVQFNDTSTNTPTIWNWSYSNLSYTSQYPPAQSNTYVKATTERVTPTLNYAYYATDPTKSLIGVNAGNGWQQSTSGTNYERFHIDLGSSKVIPRIYYENYHDYGGNTYAGVNGFTLWGSNSSGSFANLTYTNDTGWTQLTTSASQFDEHTGGDTADPKYIYVTNTVAYQYYAFKFADSYGGHPFGLRRIELQSEDATSFSTDQNPVYTFSSGNWSIALNASNSAGYNITPARYWINATPITTADFVAVPVSGASPLSISFVDSSTNSPSNWDWYWYANETKSSDLQNPSTSLTTGTYNIRLYANNSVGGSWENKTGYVTVTVGVTAPVANFTADVLVGDAPLSVHFTDTSINYPTSWLWNFDGANTSFAQDPLHIYEAPGIYSVTLQSQNTAGADTETKTNYINVTSAGAPVTPTPTPTPTTTPTPTPTPVPTTIIPTPIITPGSSGGPQITGWQGLTSNGVNLSVEEITGTNVWAVYGQNPGGYTWITGNFTAINTTAFVILDGSPIMGNTKYYVTACDNTGCGNEISFQTAQITPIVTTTFGKGYKDITGMR